MHLTHRFRSVRRPARVSALLAVLLLLGLAGLRPPPVALASCGPTTMVGDTDELNAAIALYNDTLSTCTYSIQLENDIFLTADITPIENDSAGAATLTINGAGYFIDGHYQYKTFSIEDSTVTIEDLTVSTSTDHGIKIANGDLRVARSDISASTINGIWADESDVVVVDSLIGDNDNGIFTESATDLKVINTTVVGNTTSGIVVMSGTTQLTHVTIAGNGVYGLAIAFGTVTVDNSILAGNSFDCSNQLAAGIVDFNYSLVQNGTGAYPCAVTGGTDGNLTGVDPRLSPLGKNGGPTRTMLLTLGSPAVDAGDGDLSLDENGVSLGSDQRSDGYPRLAGVEVDMGATEGSCADAMGVGNETELAIAINCFNGTVVTGPHWISFVDDISLTDSPPAIINSTAGPNLYLDGDGHTLDGVGEHHTLTIIDTPDVTISNITLANSTGDAALDINGSNVMVWNSTIRGALYSGVRVENSDLAMSGSTLMNNYGRAIHAISDGTNDVILVNTTIVGNGEDNMWVVDAANLDTLRLTHVTLVDNHGGLIVESVDHVVVNNSILARNEPDCQNLTPASTVDFNNSLVQTDDTTNPCGVANDINNNFIGHDPMLLPLGNYGGITLTMPPYVLGGVISYVIDTGNYDLSLDENDIPMSVDQRGFDRVVNDIVDMGAVEGGVLIDCTSPFPMTAANVHELNQAIACFGFITEPGDYAVVLMADIDLTAMTFPIKNQTPGVALTIDGHDRTIDGLNAPYTRALTIAPHTNVTVQQTIITRGNAGGLFGRGGGIYNEGYLALIQSTVSENTAGEKGGGIFNALDGELMLVEGEISDNSSGYMGGGIANEGHMTIIDSAISYNDAVHEDSATGGGISNEGDLKLIRSTVDYNSAQGLVFAMGGGILNEAHLTVLNATIAFNVAEGDLALGGGIFSHADPDDAFEDEFDPELKIINSTISSNSAAGDSGAAGGGLFAADNLLGQSMEDPVPVWLINSTVTANSVEAPDDPAGSGVFIQVFNPVGEGIAFNVYNSILAGNNNNGAAGGDCQESGNDVLAFVSFASLYGDSGDGACGLPADADGDGNGNFVGVDAKLGPLADNGGPTQTHLPADDSPAIDSGRNNLAVDENDIGLVDDQRNFEPRIVNDTVDMGSVEVGAEEPGGGDEEAIYMTTTAAGKTKPGGLAFDNSDILKWDGAEWTLFFDGSVALQTPKKSKHNISAFWIGDDEIIMSFVQSGRKVPGITPKVEGADLVRWDGDTFTLWFDGSDVELDKKGPEGIDGLHVLPGDAASALFGEGTCVYYLMISTTGPGTVTAYGGSQLKFGGEDVLGFCATSLGENTAGMWHMLLDGSTEGVKKNAIDSISYDDDNGILYLTTKAKFKVDAANGKHSSVYAFDIGSGTFSGPLFVAPDNGLPKKVNGLQVN